VKFYETWSDQNEASIRLEPSPLAVGVHFDLADVGARPMRHVHARILAEQ
jgi:hypothetical protein